MSLRAAVRSLQRSPGFALVAAVCLALGLGANTALFTVLNALVLRPLPFQEIDRLVDVSEDNPVELCAGCAVGTSFQAYRQWRSAARSFDRLEAYQEEPFSLADGSGPVERISGALVSGGLIEALGVPPVLGRSFGPADDRAGADGVALISERLWIRRFGGDPGAVGRTIRLNGESHLVIGVMPGKFGFPEFAQVWVPIAGRREGQAPDDRSLGVVGRLAAGVTREAAAAEMTRIAAGMAVERPDVYRGWTTRISSLERPLADTGANTGIALGLAAAGFVLLITCANLANLLLARGAARRRETAVRMALGASRRAVVGSHLIESVLVALIGGALGLLVGLWALRGIGLAIGTEMPVWIDLSFDWRVFLFALALAIATGIAVGLAPALEAGRTDVQSALKAGAIATTAGRSESRLRSGLAIAQISLALVLLTGAGLVVKSFLIANRTDDLGSDPRRTLRGDLRLLESRYRDSARIRTLGTSLVERLERLPGVTGAAISTSEFLGSFVGTGSRIFLPGQPVAVPQERAPRFATAVTPGYFETTGIRILRGRGIESGDGAGAPLVAVVAQVTADRLWPGEDALGKRFRIDDGPGAREYIVVGLARDVINNLGRGPVPLIYTAFAQRASRPFTATIRTSGDPILLSGAFQAAVRELDPDQPLEHFMTGEQFLATSIAPIRFMTALMGSLGLLALVLAALGLYAVLAYLVARSTRELGIRMALGAVRGDLVRMVVTRGLRLVALAFLIGVPLALALTRLLRVALFSVSATDPVVFAIAPAVLAAVALLASYLPARRATAVDPVAALRAE